MPDSLNDISPSSDGPLDLASLFRRVRAYAIHHNARLEMRDMSIPNAIPRRVDISRQKYLRLWRLGHRDSDDIHTNPKPPILSWRTILLGLLGRPLRTRRTYAPIVSAMRPLAHIPEYALDVRPLIPIETTRTYPDLVRFPIPASRKVRRILRRHSHWMVRMALLTAVLGYGCVLGLMFIRAYVEYTTLEAYQELQSLRDVSDVVRLKATIDSIDYKFFVVDTIFTPFAILGNNSIISLPEIDRARRVIHGGYEISRILSLGFGVYGDLMHDMYGDNWFGKPFILADIDKNQINMTDFLVREKPVLDEIRIRLATAVSDYSSVGTLGNASIDSKMEKFLSQAVGIKDMYGYGLDHFSTLLTALGHARPQRYIILNQNRDELRAGGGFPWSVVTLEFYKGRLQKYAQNDIYDFDWKLYPYHEDPPEGINEITNNFGMRDANYYPEFERSFEKINFFYEKAGGGTIDTLIGINQGIIIEFLAKYGPISLPKYGLTIDDKNFSVAISTLVESKVVPYTQKSLDTFVSPKSVLFDFIEAFKTRLLEKRDFVGYAGIIESSLRNNEILIASRTPEIRNYLRNLGFLELWRRDTGNWAYPVFTSLSGNKSDRYIARTFDVRTRQIDPCIVDNTFTLSSQHTFSDTDTATITKLLSGFHISKAATAETIRIEGNGDNRTFVRVLVPPNAQLMGATGSDISVAYQTNATVLSFMTVASPGSTSNVIFTYRISPKNCENAFRLYKQPWLANFRVVSD